MNNLARISEYDLFAYLACGFSALAGWDLLFGTELVMIKTWSIPGAILISIGAYLIGHIVASLAAGLVESLFVSRCLGNPASTLIGLDSDSDRRSFPCRILWPSFREELEPKLVTCLQATMTRKAPECAEALFREAHTFAKSKPGTSDRLAAFLRLYGFCRNMAFLALLYGLAFLTKFIVGGQTNGWDAMDSHVMVYSIVALVLGAGMLHRYLKFYRLFCIEVLVSFANHIQRETTDVKHNDL